MTGITYAPIIMSRTLGLDDIPLDVFRGIVAFGMGRFTVGRLDGGMKVCGPKNWQSESACASGRRRRKNSKRSCRPASSTISCTPKSICVMTPLV